MVKTIEKTLSDKVYIYRDKMRIRVPRFDWPRRANGLLLYWKR